MRRYPSAKDLAKISKPGRYAIGRGAYLQIADGGTRSWLFRYRVGDQQHHMGLGSCAYVTLQEAREKAWEAQRQRLRGVDPLEAKREARAASKPAIMTKTFTEAADEYLIAHEAGWRGDGSLLQWRHCLKKHILPTLGRKPVNAITTADVHATLSPIWTTIPETARRARNRIELILDFAEAHEWRKGDNPARWKGRLEALLPDQRKSNGVKHYAAMPWREVPAFMARLRAEPSNIARALELAILCASRPGEVLNARWAEIDLETATWVIPPERMKAHKEHRIPLSRRAVMLLATLPRVGEYLFIGRGDGPPYRRAFVRFLRSLVPSKLTAHGFRASFKTWAEETTQFPPHIIEQALAHQVGSAVERAYRRGDLLDQRRRLMQDWADFCDRPNAGGAYECFPANRAQGATSFRRI
jgi:integrase